MAGDNDNQPETELSVPGRMGDDGPRVRLSCRDCSFERTVGPDEDVKPADVLIEHGQRTGHTLTVSRIEDDERD